MATVTCNVAGRDTTSFVAEAKKRMLQMTLAPGTYLDFAGTATSEAQSRP